MSKRILLVVYNAAHFRELFRLAKMLQSSGRHVPLMLFVSPYPTLREHYQTCLTEGISAWIRGQPFSTNQQSWWAALLVLPSLLLSAVRYLLRRTLPSSIRQYASGWREKTGHWLFLMRAWCANLVNKMKGKLIEKLKTSNSALAHFLRAYKHLRYARRVCSALRPDLLVLAEDNVEYMSGTWVQAAHRAGIPVLIVPYCLAGIEEPAAVYITHPDHYADAPKNRRLARSYPHWVYEYQGRQLVRLPASQALPLEWLRISSPLPWLMNGSFADAIAVESPFMRDFYRRQGISSSQLIITGTASDDTMFEALQNASAYRNQLYRQYGMLPDRPMILCALPPLTSAMSALHQEFSSYADMLCFWLECLKEIEGYNIFISLHPTMNRWEFAFLHEGGWWGFALAPPDTARMIALCDIYIASVSSTIRWAIACGKPVINYDVYRYRFPDFRPARGVVTVETKTDFISVLRRLTSDPEYYQALQQAQRESQAYWGTIDGQSRNRLFSLIDRLMATYQQPLAGESVKHSNSLARKLLPMRRAA